MIKNIRIREVFDSRGSSTVEAELETQAGSFRATVPAGKSTGSREVVAFPFSAAKKAAAVLGKVLEGKSFSSVREFDGALLAADGTEKKTKLGGNVMLAASIAFARARAAERGVSLWLSLRREFFPKTGDLIRQPSIFSNFVNGGAHAKSGLDIQEYMVVVRPGGNYAEDVRLLTELYRDLGAMLAKKSKGVLPVGDESGYAVSFKNNFEPVQVLSKLIAARKLGKKCSVALDAAATEFSRGKGKYRFDGKVLSSEELARVYASWFKKEKSLCSIEDPFSENDREGFRMLKSMLGEKWVVGDDLTTTDPESIRSAASAGEISAVIIKPNQIGTVSEACDAIAEARAKNVRVIISHRSGETEDQFIISLARASAADGVKIGAPARERMGKFNELIRLYEE